MAIKKEPADYDAVRKFILENCTEAKTLLELATLSNVDKNVVYRCANYLCAEGSLKLGSNKVKKAQTYLTVRLDFTPPVVKHTYAKKEVHTSSLGGTIYSLDKEFNRNAVCYQNNYKLSQQMRVKEYKSSRTYVGISSIYND